MASSTYLTPGVYVEEKSLLPPSVVGVATAIPAFIGYVVKAVPTLRFDAEQYGPVPAGDITFGYVNEDTVRHTLIVAKDDQKVPNFKLVINKKGDVDSGPVTLEAGTYTLICDVPGHNNMRATLIVE